MTKELTDRVKNEIVNRQIDFLKANYPDESTNYDTLKEHLAESLVGYSSKKLEIDERVDMNLLESLEGWNYRVAARLFDAARYVNDISHREDVLDRHLIALHEINNDAIRYFHNYGKKTSQLLVKYLTEKGFIGEEEK